MESPQLILTLLDQAYEKSAWHGPNLKQSIRGVTAAQAYALCSFKVDFRVGEAVNQVKMVYGAIPKGLLARGKS